MTTVLGAAVLTVAAVYYVWRAGEQARRRREGVLHRRVAYMLWVMAEEEGEAAEPSPFAWHLADS
jgi:hypothetical protein